MLKALQLMKRDLVKVSDCTTVLDAAKVMREHRVGSLFVEHNSKIIGIVTETDIVREVIGSGRMPGFITVGRIMSSPVIGIDQRRPITEVADLMDRHRTRHLAVLEGTTIVGVLSVRDLLHPVSIDEF
jgi:CBS domain-containing protein